MKIIAYHGTTAARATYIENNGIKDSTRRPRWLGPGVYFYQNAFLHASIWATQMGERRKDQPVVFAAEIDISDAIDLVDAGYWDLFRDVIKIASPPADRQIGPEALFRIRSDAEENKFGWNYEDHYYVTLLAEKVAEIKPVRAIRAAFIEGKPLHERAWLLDQAHVQICVRDPSIVSKLQRVTAPLSEASQ